MIKESALHKELRFSFNPFSTYLSHHERLEHQCSKYIKRTMIKQLATDLLSFIKRIKLMRRIKAGKKPIKSGTIIINAARSHDIQMHIELYLSYLLASTGMKVYVLYDDGLLAHWDLHQVSHRTPYLTPYQNTKKNQLYHQIKKLLISKSYYHPNITILKYSSIISELKINLEHFELTEIEKLHSESSVKRYFEEGVMDLSKQSHSQYYDKSVHNCRVSKAIAKYTIAKLNPDLFLTSHGIYSVWGPSYDLVKAAGIPVLVWAIQGNKKQEIILIDINRNLLSQSTDWKKFKKHPLPRYCFFQ